MMNVKLIVLFVSSYIWMAFSSGEELTVVTITNINHHYGSIQLAVFDNEVDFVEQKTARFHATQAITSRADQELVIPNLGAGEYAIALYHDLNDNGKLDVNLMGIPKEPYAFSNNPIVKWSAPTFKDAAFQLSHNNGRQQVLVLKTWSEH